MHVQGVPGGNFNILGGPGIGHSKQNVYMYKYVCPIPNGFRDRVISLYSRKIVDKEILRIVCNIGIYCSNDKVGTFYPVQYIFENSTVNISALCNSCECTV
jgi:hypothetical protein